MVRRPVPQNPPGTNGLKRHPALVPLSRDHHAALVQALGLRRASEARPKGPSAVAVAESFLQFYADELLGHIDDEERALLPRVSVADPEGAARIREEHEELGEQVARLREVLSDGRDPRPLMNEIGDLLEGHVRFEERAFFEAVQARVLPAALEEAGRAVAENRRVRGRGEGCTLPPRLR